MPTKEDKELQTRSAFAGHMYVIFVLVFVTAFFIFAALRLGGDYYLTTISERPNHVLHETFKPSGLVGQGFGIIGGLFCLLTLLYPLRKRWRLLENLGTPRTWFRFHIYFGIAGPLFATLHTTFKFAGIASICYWSMMLVMASGFVGRFLFAQLPRNQRGLLLSLQEIEAEIKSIRRALAAADVRENEIEWLATTADRKSKDEETAWRNLFHGWLWRRRNLREWNRRLQEQGFTPSSIHHILSLLSRKLFLEGSLATLGLTSRVFSQWHSLHLPFTYLMFATLMIHVGLAIFLGYTWIF